jgi:hypothetical protein
MKSTCSGPEQEGARGSPRRDALGALCSLHADELRRAWRAGHGHAQDDLVLDHQAVTPCCTAAEGCSEPNSIGSRLKNVRGSLLEAHHGGPGFAAIALNNQ